jgi:NADH:ubiquinone oxidoreductase subunit K
MFGEFAEKRILAFFVYFELTHLLCVLLLISWGLIYGSGLVELCTASLFIIGSSGSETGIALALFMRYFRLTGRTVFFNYKTTKQPFVAKALLVQ